MNAHQMIVDIRDDYIDQLRAFVSGELARDPGAEANRPVPRPQSRVLSRRYVPDIYVAGPVERMSDLVPREREGKVPPFAFSGPELTVRFDDLWWDDLRVDHDGVYAVAPVSAWFRRWFPQPGAAIHRPEGLEGFIHSATVDERWLTLDMGPPAPRRSTSCLR